MGEKYGINDQRWDRLLYAKLQGVDLDSDLLMYTYASKDKKKKRKLIRTTNFKLEKWARKTTFYHMAP